MLVNYYRKLEKGFTLIEVMLAMAVFSIAGIAILGTAETNARNLGYLESKILANWVASNQLVEITLDDTWPPKNNKKGKVELAGLEWFWQQKVVKTTDKDMRAIVLEVRLDEKDPSALTSLMTYISKQNK
ncbi:type II secretion system minor pseudopilin GspI [Colwellia polaris]|jgi:general secretion pathway protein I|uniref:type II secretion system minor pseudopilin GspI n=1 Tax=Colwellia polaris TaxID=326537 RepID=UPI000A177A2B|nr:type II secretion system minor pseudopilin GspI [Colwellia polaris]|tara:strand:- start:600 stop:989 length:390 start_codon:yes stop_codon:yes gene_type:complete